MAALNRAIEIVVTQSSRRVIRAGLANFLFPLSLIYSFAITYPILNPNKISAGLVSFSVLLLLLCIYMHPNTVARLKVSDKEVVLTRALDVKRFHRNDVNRLNILNFSLMFMLGRVLIK